MKYFFLLIWILIGIGVYGQTLKGRVQGENLGKKEPLFGANVYWLGTTIGVVTDEEGNFSIAREKPGKLVVSYIGYTSDTLSVDLKDTFVEILLKAGQELEEVTVMRRGQTTIMNTKGPLIEQVITGEELCKAACCNLGESFTTNASVDVSYADAVTGAKQIQLLGLNGKYVQMMTENMPNFRGVSALYGLNYIPGPWMSAISVSKGAGSVINGYEAIAGQISVDYKKPPTSEKIFLNMYGSDEGMIEFNMNSGILLNDKWSTAILAHGNWMNQSHDSHHDGFLDMPKTTQYNLMNRWAYKTDEWFVQFGGKFLDEDRLGGQKGFRKSMRKKNGNIPLYGIQVDTRRYEGFLKVGYLMPQYENTSMALLVNYTNHDQKSYYGIRDYNARQQSLYMNYIYQSIFGNNINQKYSAGLMFTYDKFDESFNDFIRKESGLSPTPEVFWNREERVGGAFFQYTGHFWEKVTVMAGMRYDYHNLAGGFFTPRFHLAYTPDEWTTLKFSAGKGARWANVLAENSYMLASSRSVYVNDKLLVEHPEELKKLKMEKAWNFGVLLNRKFVVFDRLLNINLDYYRTDFSRQVIVDNEMQENQVNFYNLQGKSYSNCYQVEVRYELVPRLDVLGAFRYNDAHMTYRDKEGEKRLLRTPLQSKYKGLLNLSYYTNMKKWQFDFTTQFNGPGRLPVEGGNFESFQIMNAQVSKFFRRRSVYAGCENIGDFMQKHPILSADDPWGAGFDASRIWGPLHGRKFYLGLRFGIDRD